MAATDIFHCRKYPQIRSTTRIRKTMSPVIDRLATSLPQLGPISSMEMSALVTPTVDWMVEEIVALSAGVSGSVSTRMELWPAVVTTTCWAASMPVPDTASRSLSALSCVISPLGTETVYCAPPTNSMP